MYMYYIINCTYINCVAKIEQTQNQNKNLLAGALNKRLTELLLCGPVY